MADGMALGEHLGIQLALREALAVGLILSLIGSLVVTPRAIRKLRGAGIVGHDQHKEDRPAVPEMGGLAVFIVFNMGVFAVLLVGRFQSEWQMPVLAGLVVAAGACITGVLDDLVELRQRFKAFIPFAFAAPLALFAPNYVIRFPGIGSVDMGLAYPLLLVPLAIACASNGFNMLEGFNGLGAGLGVLLASALSILAIANGNYLGLVLLFPMVGTLGGFLWYNTYPARVFPGDTMTLLVGAVLATAAILSKVEFWGALLFAPHIIEFFLKASGGFRAESFATKVDNGRLVYEGPTQSLTHIIMKRFRPTEPQLVGWIWLFEAVYIGLVLAAFFATRRIGF